MGSRGSVAIDAVEYCPGHDAYAVGWLVSVGILTVLDDVLTGTDVLCHLSSQGNGQCLYASADAQHGYLTVVGQTDSEQLG